MPNEVDTNLKPQAILNRSFNDELDSLKVTSSSQTTFKGTMYQGGD